MTSSTLQPMVPDRPSFLDGSKGLYIAGRWVDAVAGEFFQAISPSAGEVLAQVSWGRPPDIDRAVVAARSAFEGPWRHAKPAERQRVLLALADLVERHGDELAAIDSWDMGAPISRTLASKARWVGLLRYYAGLAVSISGSTVENSIPGKFLSYTVREPVGVVGAIVPWNGPMTSLIWKLAPVLATGCTVVLKPAREAALSALRVAELIERLDLPDGVINVVPGGADAGQALALHPGVDKIAFTGSTATGQSVIRASAGNIKRLSLELGGKSPDIVFADANLDKAVAGAAMAAFANSGQICSAGTRLFVQRPIYDEFVESVAAHGRALRMGHALDPRSQLGPVVSELQLQRVMQFIDDGRAAGAKIVTGGQSECDGALRGGHFVPPTVFSEVDPGMRIAREEIFGPVLCAIPFDDIDEAIHLANDSIFGLGSGVWTQDLSKAHRVASAVRAGSVWVNCYQATDPAIPFGGYKQSGYGRESGVQHLDSYLETKAVVVNLD